MQIAVVEDNAMIRNVLLAVLEDMPGCSVSGFGAATPALAACADVTFDLFILDYRLPDMTGIDAMRRLRADQRFAHVPIVMVTADSDTALRLEAIRAGATDFLTKPVNIEELRLRVGNLLALRRAQREMATREALLSAVIDASTASIVISDATQPDLPLIYVNRAFEHLSGYSREAVLGQNCRVLSAESPDHAVRQALREAAALRQAGKFRLRNQRATGEVFWNQIDLHPVPGPGAEARYVVATQTDVTAEVEASRSRDRLGARLSDIAQLSDAWFFEFDRDLRISYLSPAMAQALEVAPEEVQGLPVSVLGRHVQVDPDGAGGDLRSLLERRSPATHIPLKIARRDGSTCWMQISVAPFFTAEGWFDGVRGFASDVSTIIAARDAAQQAERAQGAFVAMMSHELRTPLTAIIGLAEVLEGSCPSDSRRGDLQTIRRAASDLTGILSDVLDHAQLEGGRLKLADMPLSLTAILGDMLAELAPRAAQAGLSLRLEVEGAGSPDRRGDPDRLRQILRNLLDNALRFTAQGGVTVTLTLPDTGPARIEIADTGMGIDPADLDRIFQPFVQVDAGMGRVHGGRGLGLSLARKLSEAMGGQLTAQSQPGMGSTFRLDLPLPATQAPAPDARLNLTGASVLVADDNRANRKLLSLMLARLGAEVTLVEDGRSAVEAWAPGRFAVLLLDINMPAMTGTEVIADIRQQELAGGRRQVPAFAVTANSRPEQVETYLAAGFDGCIAKPLTLAALSAALGARVQPAPGLT